MLTNTIFTVSYLLLFALSAYYYKNDPKHYAASKENKSEGSVKGYSFVNIYLRITTLLVALLSVYSDSIYLLIIHNNTTLAYIGLFFTSIGMYFFIQSRSDLGENYSPCYDAYLPHSITKQGLYSLVRHPIYSSNIFILVALFLATGSLWMLLNVLVLSYFYNKSAKSEELELTSKYADYGIYIDNTNRYIPSPRQVLKQLTSRS